MADVEIFFLFFSIKLQYNNKKIKFQQNRDHPHLCYFRFATV